MEPDLPVPEELDESTKGRLVDLEGIDHGQKVSAAELHEAELLPVGVKAVRLGVEPTTNRPLGFQPNQETVKLRRGSNEQLLGM
jgi:hypothetical protein